MGNLDSGFASGLDASNRRLGFFSLPDSKCFDKGLSTAEALEQSGMDFGVEKRPVYRKMNDGSVLVVPEKFETYRTDNEGHLGVVGNQYSALQNEDAFAIVDEILGHGATIRSAGTWNGGADTFITAQLQNGIKAQDFLDADLYLLWRNNHTGAGSVSCYITPVDPRCNNMFPAAIKQAVSSWKCRHTSTLKSRLQEASTTLKLVDTFRDAMTDVAIQLHDTDMALDEFNEFLKELTSAERVQERIRAVYNESPNLTNGNRWGAFSAVTEFIDWCPVRQTGQETRFASQIDGASARTRERALRLLTR